MQLYVRFLSDSVETVVAGEKCETMNGKPLKNPKEGMSDSDVKSFFHSRIRH